MFQFSESSSDDDEPSNVTETNPNLEKKEKCKCGTGCKTRKCNCLKFGSGCNPSCDCRALCDNMFNNLSYFFGDENEKCDADPCFVKWLIKNGRDSNGLMAIDRDHLRNLIMANRK